MGTAAYVAKLRARVGHDLLLLPAVCALAFNEIGELLVHQRSDTGRWSLPGGAVDPGEQPADAVVREVLEETGVRVAPTRITGVYLTPEVRYPNGDLVQYVITAFECTSDPGDLPRVNDDESLAVGYFALDALPDLLPAHLERITHAGRQQAAAFFEPAQHRRSPDDSA
jgi:8-oxo-dGTP diphosphatase